MPAPPPADPRTPQIRAQNAALAAENRQLTRQAALQGELLHALKNATRKTEAGKLKDVQEVRRVDAALIKANAKSRELVSKLTEAEDQNQCWRRGRTTPRTSSRPRRRRARPHVATSPRFPWLLGPPGPLARAPFAAWAARSHHQAPPHRYPQVRLSSRSTSPRQRRPAAAVRARRRRTRPTTTRSSAPPASSRATTRSASLVNEEGQLAQIAGHSRRALHRALAGADTNAEDSTPPSTPERQ